MPIKVAIVEDEAGIRESLAILINGAEGFKCIAAFPHAEIALKQLPRDWPDVLLMDINLPTMSGIECVAKLKEIRPSLQVLMLTICADDDEIFNSLMNGASGYLLKKTSPADILDAIAEVHAGGAPMSGSIARKVVRYFQLQKTASNTDCLSKRENEILGHLAKGLQNKEIAEALSITAPTVSKHIQNIYEKLHVHSRTEAVVKFLSGHSKTV